MFKHVYLVKPSIYMDRNDFIKKGLMGAGLIASGSAVATVLKKEHDSSNTIEHLGFNHIPNTQSTTNMENTVLHKASTRGDANHGWLHSKHTFSFANYYNPERMNFGVLRVLNDDIVSGGKGFGTHPHDNMEIISIPLKGDLEHKDSMGNVTVIKNGDVQVMSAGTGIQHSEYNKNTENEVRFLQIWVHPNKRNVTPRYDQITLKAEDRHNTFQQILSPNADDAGVWIHQNAWFHLATFDAQHSQVYKMKDKANGLYVFDLTGDIRVNGQLLNTRDGFGIWNVEEVRIEADTNAEFLLMEVQMTS